MHSGIELMKTEMIRKYFILTFLSIFIHAQGDFVLEDLNPNSDTYGNLIGPSYYLDDIVVVFFGHEY